MVTLTTDEMKVYNTIVNHIIPRLVPGNYMARDFFGNDPTVPRIVRRIYEEVKAGNIARVALIGSKSREGYRIS